jgi:hypothetical protein
MHPTPRAGGAAIDQRNLHVHRPFYSKEQSMRSVCGFTVLALGLGLLTLAGIAQEPKDKPARKGGPPAASSLVERLMAFDKNKDGKLTRDEITDERLLRLFDRADANKDGVVTKEELTALAKKMAEDAPAEGGRRGFGPPGGPPGGPGGPGGPGMFRPPQPGQILPPFLQETLKLNDDQKKQLAELQKEVDGKLDKILTEKQKKQIQDMRRGFGRGGPGGPGGRGPGGPPPGGDNR